ncbi:MAG: hypothetical protein WDZ94_04630 [Patescibacteria group bacterium]
MEDFQTLIQEVENLSYSDRILAYVLFISEQVSPYVGLTGPDFFTLLGLAFFGFATWATYKSGMQAIREKKKITYVKRMRFEHKGEEAVRLGELSLVLSVILGFLFIAGLVVFIGAFFE